MLWSTSWNAIHGVLEGKGKVITVVGAGGNRDKGKRPIMAKKEAAKASDRVIITSDNPRFEEPQDIINDMLAGLDNEDKKTLSIADRKEAIRTACMLAEKRRCDSGCRKRTRELSGNQRGETSL